MAEERQEGASDSPETARTVGQLVKYSREVNQADTVDEVATYALEATFHVMDGHPSPTVVEVRNDTLRVLESMSPRFEPGGDPGPVARRAYENDESVIDAGDGTDVGYAEGASVVDVDDDGTTIAAPSVYSDEMGEAGVVLVNRWTSLDRVEEYHLKPLQYLADHVATSVNNVRSRERLERARNDLEKRKEMVEVYDRLLRHDLGNDLQVITGFSEVLVESLDGGQEADYAEKIHDTARSANELIDDVGDVVKTLEEEKAPEPRDLGPVVEGAVEDVDTKFDSLTVEFDADEFEGRVYAGELLDSIFTNVLSNAAVHNDDPVTVRVFAEEPTPDSVVVGFADDGTGIPEEVRDEIFEMGKKGPDSEGTGFGLGLARTLIESYGGRIEVGESEMGGAEFHITLQRP